jgi:hypothetical protein
MGTQIKDLTVDEFLLLLLDTLRSFGRLEGRHIGPFKSGIY